MGQSLLADLGITLDKLDHRLFDKAKALIDTKGEEYFSNAVQRLDRAIKNLYGDKAVSLQRLAATFRRGDLMYHLPPEAQEVS